MRQRLESPTKGPNPLVNRTLHGMAGLGTISFLPKPAMPFRRLPRTSGLDTPCFAPGESAPIGEDQTATMRQNR